MTTSEHPFRRFALTVHDSEGVPSASILLQDTLAADVNVLLLAAYVGAVRGGCFGEEQVAAASHRIGEWQTEVVTPLRSVRRRLKHGPFPVPNDVAAELRDRVKALELDAELAELDALSALVDELVVPAAQGPADQRAAAAVHAAVAGGLARELTGDERQAITVIARAAARYEGKAR